jgi:pimeloyl-ACP methyl ester carboxylesterase
MALKLDPKVPGHLANSRFLAIACDLTYFVEAEAGPRFEKELGLSAKLVAVDNVQAYVCENEDAIVVAFRGSENPASLDGLKDWLLTNANNFLVLPEGRIGTDFAAAGVGARFHRGFMQALDLIWEPLFAAVDSLVQTKDRPLWVTGHSLGGALALLSAWRLQRNFLTVHAVHSFGAPMIGNAAAASAFETEFPGRIFRFVDSLDLVPKLPMMSLIANEYGHCPAEMLLEAKSASADSAPAGQAISDVAGDVKEGVLSLTLVDNLWALVNKRIAHHMMPNYQSRLSERDGTA